MPHLIFIGYGGDILPICITILFPRRPINAMASRALCNIEAPSFQALRYKTYLPYYQFRSSTGSGLTNGELFSFRQGYATFKNLCFVQPREYVPSLPHCAYPRAPHYASFLHRPAPYRQAKSSAGLHREPGTVIGITSMSYHH